MPEDVQPKPAPAQPEKVHDAPKKPERPTDELVKAKKIAEEYLNGWKRAKADYLNLKKDSAKREQEIVQFANAALIIELLPIYNHLKLALKHAPQEQKSHQWMKGIEHIATEFKTLLSNINIHEIETAGKTFDPELHEAVAKEKIEGKEHGEILEEIQPGYIYHGKTLQAAKVKIAE